MSGAGARRERAVTPVVSKTLEIGLVLLFVGGLSTTLFGGVVPDYRDAAGDRVADRTIAGAATDLESAIPPRAVDVRVERRVPLPATIRGAGYRIIAADGTLTVDHPNSAVRSAASLALPERVVSVTGTWHSGATTVVVVSGGGESAGVATVEVTLVNR